MESATPAGDTLTHALSSAEPRRIVAAIIATLPERAARSIAAGIVRNCPRQGRPDAYEAVRGAIAEAGEAGITLAELTRRLRLPSSKLRSTLELLVDSESVEAEPDERIGPGRPAVRFRLIPRQGR
jgi:CHASE2 domain-containing sensor protein